MILFMSFLKMFLQIFSTIFSKMSSKLFSRNALKAYFLISWKCHGGEWEGWVFRNAP